MIKKRQLRPTHTHTLRVCVCVVIKSWLPAPPPPSIPPHTSCGEGKRRRGGMGGARGRLEAYLSTPPLSPPHTHYVSAGGRRGKEVAGSTRQLCCLVRIPAGGAHKGLVCV